MRRLDTFEYVTLLRELTEEGREVRLEVSGSSMLPFLADGRDAVFLRRAEPPFRVGEVVCYQRRSGRYVLHRICAVRPEGLYLAGDAQRELEGPIAPEQVFARVTRVIRRGVLLEPGTLCWGFFARLWPRLRRLRRPLLALFGRLERVLRP